MRTRPSIALLVALLTAGLATATSAAVVPVGRAARSIRAEVQIPPARLLVYAQEWSLWPSRPRVKAGRVIVQLWNRGQDAHDLRIRRLNRHGVMVGRSSPPGVGTTASGQLRQATWQLSPGTYELYCAMPGHMRLGMHARITAG